MGPICSSLLTIDWKIGLMAGAPAATLDHEMPSRMEATCWENEADMSKEPESPMAAWSHHANLGLPIHRLLLCEKELNLYSVQPTAHVGFLHLSPKVFLVDRHVPMVSLLSR